MTWLDLSRIFFSLIAVIGLIGVFAIIAKRFAALQSSFANRQQKRLQLMETLSIDTKRKIAIIRCDDREHLIILGPQSENVLDAHMPSRPKIATSRQHPSRQRQRPLIHEEVKETAQGTEISANPFQTLLQKHFEKPSLKTKTISQNEEAA